MVINNKAKPFTPPGEEEKRQEILNVLQQESLTVLSLAYNYAKGYEMCGADVTKQYENIGYNMAWVKQAYSKGFQAGLDFVEQQKQIAEKRRLDIWKKQQGLTVREGDDNE